MRVLDDVGIAYRMTVGIATRRQLREYSAVFQADGVLLVDVPDRRIRRVVFSGT